MICDEKCCGYGSYKVTKTWTTQTGNVKAATFLNGFGWVLVKGRLDGLGWRWLCAYGELTPGTASGRNVEMGAGKRR